MTVRLCSTATRRGSMFNCASRADSVSGPATSCGSPFRMICILAIIARVPGACRAEAGGEGGFPESVRNRVPAIAAEAAAAHLDAGRRLAALVLRGVQHLLHAHDDLARRDGGRDLVY